MEYLILSADGVSSNPHLNWILLIPGIILLLFGAPLYYSAIRVFGGITGAIVGVLVCFNVVLQSDLNEMTIIFLYIVSLIVGGLLGSMIAILFHHFIFFVFGAVIGIILYKMFALKLITPETFTQIQLVEFVKLIKPTTGVEWIVSIIGGVIYMASSRILIIITMALVGGFLIAAATKIYFLFPVLAVFGAVIQHLMTRRRVVKLVKKKATSE